MKTKSGVYERLHLKANNPLSCGKSKTKFPENCQVLLEIRNYSDKPLRIRKIPIYVIS